MDSTQQYMPNPELIRQLQIKPAQAAQIAAQQRAALNAMQRQNALS